MDAKQKIEAALAAGPTEGPWQVLPEECDKPYIRIRGTRLAWRYKIANVLTPVYEDATEREALETRANAELITACNPAAIREVLQTLASKEAEIARLREALGNYVKCIASGGGGDMDLFMAAIREVDNQARAALTQPTQHTE